jgi:hypothetical protein
MTSPIVVPAHAPAFSLDLDFRATLPRKKERRRPSGLSHSLCARSRAMP